MSDRRFLPSWADTPVEAAYVLDETRRHVNDVEDITRDPRVDGDCNPPPMSEELRAALTAAYEAANKRGAA